MNASQKRAITEHRRRLGERGLARYEVRGLPQDKELVRKFAKKLSADDAEAARLRNEVTKAVAMSGFSNLSRKRWWCELCQQRLSLATGTSCATALPFFEQ